MTALSQDPTVTSSDWTIETLHAAFERQRQEHLRAGPPDLALRRNRLDRLGAALAGNADALVRAISADYGNRPLAGALAAEVLLQLEDIRSTKKSLATWMKPRHPQPRYLRAAGLATGLKAWVEPTPLGVVGVIAPWNFPVALAVQPAIAAIAAGNRVMIKMSDLTPRTAEALRSAIAAHFDPAEVTVVTGDLDIATAFSSLPFDHIFFTGSPAVAKHIQRAAADHLTPVTLELGGKSPTVLAPDADVAKWAKRIVKARLANSGQLCLSPDYVFVPRARVNAFLTAAEDACRKALPTVADNTDFCTIINDNHFRRISALIEDARKRGATVREVIPAGERLPDAATRRIPFTLLTDTTPDMEIMQEEIFGPVLPVVPYDTVDEVIDEINSRPVPLGSYWFGPDSADFRRFVARTRSGGVTRNDFALHASLAGLPFGGVGNSGTGYYHGQYGFETFSHLRAVAVSPNAFSPVSLLSPPFNPVLEKGLRSVVGLWSKRLGKKATPHHRPKGTT
ncbi:coniferyl aldehyde dehydrogenase [Sporichthya polymorpha]|uniref:coniferyl aldehyde dehydrogenase n=1 Tax=Sporichthya polymorpha TaxID=35751 RepID=UPI00037D42FD|nr:coniferyl aldehyde dehydrogenase [Sporichthya polymorpha]